MAFYCLFPTYFESKDVREDGENCGIKKISNKVLGMVISSGGSELCGGGNVEVGVFPRGCFASCLD